MEIPSHNQSNPKDDLIPHLQKFTNTIDDFEFVISIAKEYTGKLDTEFTVAAIKRLVNFERETRNVISSKNHIEAENFLTNMLQPTLKLLSVAIKRALDGDMYDLQNRLEELRQQGISLTTILSRRKSKRAYFKDESPKPSSPVSRLTGLDSLSATAPLVKRDLMSKGLSTSALMPRPDLFRRAQPRTLTSDNLFPSSPPTSPLSSPLTSPLISPTRYPPSPLTPTYSQKDIPKCSSHDSLPSLSPHRGGSPRIPRSAGQETIVRKKKPRGISVDFKNLENSKIFPKTSSSEGSIPKLNEPKEGETYPVKSATARGTRERSASSSGKKSLISKKKSRKPKSTITPIRLGELNGGDLKWKCPRENCGNLTSEFYSYCCFCGYPRDPKFLFNSKIERLDKRIHWPSVDDRLGILIKSGDITGIQWMIKKGWPINYSVQDAQGTCYDASELAKKYNQSEVRDFFLDLEKTGPPRQKITLSKEGEDPADFIVANSPEDFVLFKREVEEFFDIQDVKFCEIGSPETARVPLEWFELKAEQRYTVYSRTVK